jgi:integrase
MAKHKSVTEPRKRLTEANIAKLLPRAARYDAMDLKEAGFGLRISPAGTRTWVMFTRFPGSPHPSRRELGDFDALSLDEARAKAAKWRKLIKQGIDPKDEEERIRLEKFRRDGSAFSLVAEAYLKRCAELRSFREVERIVQNILVPKWGTRSIGKIDERDIADLILGLKKHMGHLVLGTVKALFKFAKSSGHIKENLARDISPKDLLGAKAKRQRCLSDDELGAFWRASEALAYPYGRLFQLLALTGLRLSEAKDATWGEVDLEKKLLTVPTSRFKTKQEHKVPLSDMAVALLQDLPRYQWGDYLFSASFGQSPIQNYSKVKRELDKAMAADLGRRIEPWVLHDLRRVVRGGMSSLRVPFHTAELILGHSKLGNQAVYDRHDHVDEMRDALQLWANRIRDLVTPPPANVENLAKRRSRAG